MATSGTQEETKQIGYPLQPCEQERVQVISIDDSVIGDAGYLKQSATDWHIMYTNHGRMSDTNAIEGVQRYLGLQQVPEMLFGDSRLFFACPKHDFLLTISPIDCLRLCKFEDQAKRVYVSASDSETTQAAATEDPSEDISSRLKDLNSIDFIPEVTQAH